MKHLLFIVLSLFFFNKIYSADFEWTSTGTDEFPIYMEVNKNKIFMTYNSKFQFVTNTALFGFANCSGIIEMIDGQQNQNIMCAVTDSHGNKGYAKTIPAEKKKIIGNMVGDRIGSSVGSWMLLGGEGPFAELEGTIMTGAYFAMGKNNDDEGNFIWTGKIEGLPKSTIDRINNYIPKNKE